MWSSINPQNNMDLNQGILHLWSKFGGPSLNGWWVIVRTSSKWGKFLLWSLIWPWKSRSITPQNNRDLNQGLLHLWSKFGDPSWNRWWVIVRTSSWLTHGRTHTHTDRFTDAGNDNTRRPKLASGKNCENNAHVGWSLQSTEIECDILLWISHQSFLYCLIVIQLIMSQWINKSAIVQQ